MDRVDSDRETACIKHTTVTMAILGEYAPSVGERVPACQTSKLPVLTGSLRGFQLHSFMNFDYKQYHKEKSRSERAERQFSEYLNIS